MYDVATPEKTDISIVRSISPSIAPSLSPTAPLEFQQSVRIPSVALRDCCAATIYCCVSSTLQQRELLLLYGRTKNGLL